MKSKQLPIIERHILLNQIGKGGNGIVYEATDKDSQTVVVKILSNPKGYNLGRFKNEISALSKLSDVRGVMPILDYNLDGDIKWYSMPLAIPSKEFLSDKSYYGIIEFYSEIANTLRELHLKEIYHRDIKPDNLLVLDGIPVIADFGLVQLPDAEHLTKHGDKLGPAFFIAPEMIGNPDTADSGKADVYSFAKSLWVALTDQNFPIIGEHDLTYKPILVSSYINDSRLLQIDSLISLATKLDPEKRINIGQVADNLQEWLKPQASMSKEYKTSDILKSLAITATTEKEEHDRWDKYHNEGNEVFGQLYSQLQSFFTSLKTDMGDNGQVGGFQKVSDLISSKRESSYDSIKKTVAGGGYSFIIYEPVLIEFYCGIGMEIFKNGEINWGAGYIIIIDKKEQVLWSDNAIVALHTPEQVNLNSTLYNGLLDNFDSSMKKLEEIIKESKD